MKIVKEILVLLQVLPWMGLFAVGKPLTGCSLTSEIELYDPTDTGAEIMCRKCPECPEGQGLTPQCGSRVSSYTKIECTPCKAEVSYSDSHGIESCKACHKCGLKNIIQNCTPDKNRKCGTKCPQGYFLDDNHICQECYFCCNSVSDAQRRQGCIDIGMTRDWQCEKTEQNQHCKEKVTTKQTDTEPTLTAPPNHNTITMTGTHVKTHVHNKFATTLPHQPGQNLKWSQTLSVDGSTVKTIQGTGNVALLSPENDGSANATQSAKNDKEQEEHRAVSLRVVIGVVTIIFFISVLALMTSKRVKQLCRFSRPNQRNLEEDIELIPQNSNYGHTDSCRASTEDIHAVAAEVPPLSRADNNLTTEEHEECEEKICKPNPADIPTDCRVSEMVQLRDDEGTLMLFYIKKKLDALETSTRKTWRSIGQVFQVSSDDLNAIETDYMARQSPTESLIELLKNREKEPTMREFVEALIICGRQDVADVICNWPWAK